MKTNAAGVALIKRWESLKLDAYLCPAGVWTIGYGHTGDVKQGQRITEHQADIILAHDLERFERGVEELTRGAVLTENEFSALVSLAFNIGLAALGKSTLLAKLLGGYARGGVASEFSRWIHANGKALPGLVKRRADEAALFLEPVRG